MSKFGFPASSGHRDVVVLASFSRITQMTLPNLLCQFNELREEVALVVCGWATTSINVSAPERPIESDCWRVDGELTPHHARSSSHNARCLPLLHTQSNKATHGTHPSTAVDQEDKIHQSSEVLSTKAATLGEKVKAGPIDFAIERSQRKGGVDSSAIQETNRTSLQGKDF